MTKEEFKKKYHGQVIAIAYPIGLGSFNTNKEVVEKTFQLRNISQEMGLKVTELTYMSHVGQPNVAISVEEFLEDFGNYVEEEQRAEAVKVLDILSGMKIKNVDIKHVEASRNMKQLAEDGFIQGYTSNEASLWWNPKGRRLLFVRGEGVFELTDKVEENA